MDIVFSLLTSAISSGLYDKLKKFMGQKHVSRLMKKLQDMAVPKTIIHHQGEVYYNALDRYIASNNVVSNLIRMCYDKSVSGFQLADVFSTSHTDKFIGLNKLYIGQKGIIFDIFMRLYETIDSAINDCKFSEETRIITNKITESTNTNTQAFQKMQKTLEEIRLSINQFATASPLLNSKSIMSNTSEVIASEKDEIYNQYYQRVKNIINENQGNERLHNGIYELNAVIQDIADNAHDMSFEGRVKLLLYVHDTLAQFHVNIGDLDKAQLSIEKAEKHVKNLGEADCARHYFINAYVLMHFRCEEKYKSALDLLDKSISTGELDHNAVLLKFKIESVLSLSSHYDQILKLEQFFTEHIEECKDDTLTANYYQTLGFVNLQNSCYQEAINALEKSQKIQSDIVNKANMAITYYSWAVADCEKDVRLVRPLIDYSKLIICMELISSLLDKPEKLYASLQKVLIPIYISACHFCGQHENISRVAEYVDCYNSDYETIRTIAYGKSFTGEVHNISFDNLAPEDQIFLRMLEEKKR